MSEIQLRHSLVSTGDEVTPYRCQFCHCWFKTEAEGNGTCENNRFGELKTFRQEDSEPARTLSWALDLVESYEQRLIQLGDPEHLVKSDIQNVAIERAKAVLAFFRRNGPFVDPRHFNLDSAVRKDAPNRHSRHGTLPAVKAAEVARPHAEQVSSPATVQPASPLGEILQPDQIHRNDGAPQPVHAAAGEWNEIGKRLAADDSDSTAGACNCLTKSPVVQYHKKGCKYRLIKERDDLKAKLEDAERERNKLINSSVEYLTALTGAERDVQTLKAGDRDLKAKCEALERGLKNHERMTEACNQIFRDAAKSIEHLWPEAERPIGVQMICHKVQEMEKALRELRDACHAADVAGELSDYVDGTLLEQADAALAGGKETK